MQLVHKMNIFFLLLHENRFIGFFILWLLFSLSYVVSRVCTRTRMCHWVVIIGKLMIHATSPARDSLDDDDVCVVTSSMKSRASRPWSNLAFDLILQIFIYKKRNMSQIYPYSIKSIVQANWIFLLIKSRQLVSLAPLIILSLQVKRSSTPSQWHGY